MSTTTTDKKAVGENLRLYRERHGLSQNNLADILDLTRPSVSAWERGQALPSTEHLMQLCELYQVDMETLLGKDTSQKTSDEDDNKQDDDKQKDDNQITCEAEPSKPKRRQVRIYILWFACLFIIGTVIFATLMILRRQPQETDEPDDIVPISEMESQEFDITSVDSYFNQNW